ncbi:MAG TPA: ATP-binding protein, partial [Bacteroidetes bacterium]|nr:ATP-binding protein [Bacteroidota bacterium]
TLREEADSVILEVSDQGYGIPEKHLGRIFDKFFRVKDEAAQEERGTGLGLSLVKEIVELHKGIIKVESTIGNGSVFRVILPRQRSIQSGDGNGEAHDRMAHSVIQE